MSTLINRIFSFALLAATAAVGAAQAEQQARFHLTFAAQWGEITLAPGDYRVTLPEIALGHWNFFVTGHDARGFIIPTTTDFAGLMQKPSNRSYLQLVKTDGVFRVAKYQSAATGAIFTFKLPKPQHKVEMASQEVVNVDVAGN
jgi:hypothetical protein